MARSKDHAGSGSLNMFQFVSAARRQPAESRLRRHVRKRDPISVAIAASMVALFGLASNAKAQCEYQTLRASDRKNLGSSVALSNGVAIIGSSNQDCLDGTGPYCGAAYVFRFNGNEWLEEQKIISSNLYEYGTSYVYGVAISGSIAAISTASEDSGCESTFSCRAVYIYRHNDYEWVEEIRLMRSGQESFGRAVSVGGNTLVAGGRTGVYVYRYDGAGWIEAQSISAPVSSSGFGADLVIDGDRILIGALNEACTDGPACGAAYVYRFDGSVWSEEERLMADQPQALSQFGLAVSIYGDIAVIGAPGEDCIAGAWCGAAYVFRYTSSGWVQEQRLTTSEPAAFDLYGVAVAASNDSIVVGSQYAQAYAGIAYVYRFDGMQWIRSKRLAARGESLLTDVV